MRKTKRQQFIEATGVPRVEVSVLEDGDTVKARAIVICPGCGGRYYANVLPPFCMLTGCEFPFEKKAATITPEQDLSHTRYQAVGRYVLV